MAGLVPFEVSQGQRLRIRGTEYRVIVAERREAGITLRADDGSDSLLRISRAELQALIVLEDAELLDELEDPDQRPARPATTLTYLVPHRLHDWQLKGILLRAMVPVRHLSYKSDTFQRAFRAATELVDACRELSYVTGGKSWSALTIYHTLHRWRASGYAYLALQKKGIGYSKQRSRGPTYDKARAAATEIALRNPTQSVAQTHRQIKQRLGAVLSAPQRESST